MNKEIIFDALDLERARQDLLHEWSQKTNRFAVLVEEVGEIGAALQEPNQGNLEEELVQLAAVCIRWLEEL